MPYYVYILMSEKTGSYYIGSCSDVDRRLAEHNRGKVASTRARRPWKVMYSESFQSRREAVAREHEIKRQKSRPFIDSLMSNQSSVG